MLSTVSMSFSLSRPDSRALPESKITRPMSLFNTGLPLLAVQRLGYVRRLSSISTSCYEYLPLKPGEYLDGSTREFILEETVSSRQQHLHV